MMDAHTENMRIDFDALQKGQTVSADRAWNHYISVHPDAYKAWKNRYGSEAMAKAQQISFVLFKVQDMIRNGRSGDLPKLVTHAQGGKINILTDADAVTYLNEQAFKGLRGHNRATSRLAHDIDTSQLTAAEQRNHDRVARVHGFIAAATHKAHKDLRRMRARGEELPSVLD